MMSEEVGERRRSSASRHRLMQNRWTLPESENQPEEEPRRRRRKPKTDEAWDKEKEDKGRRRKKKKEKKEPFSSVARCRNSDIRITLADEGLVWSPVEGGLARKGDAYTLRYERVLRAQPGESENSFLLQYVDVAGSLLRTKSMEVTVGDSVTARKWIKYTTQIVNGLFSRPRKTRVLIHTSAGRGNAAQTFKLHGLPKLREMGVEADISEVKNAEEFEADVGGLDKLTDYDGLLVVGNQLSFRFLLNAVMSRVHAEQEVDLRPGITPLSCPLPLGLLPIGRRADLATSVHVTSDFTTALLHFLVGARVSLDVAAIFSKSRFHGWAVNCQYGFGANALGTLPGDRTASDKRAESALNKALAKDKLLSYDCDIHFIPGRMSDVSFPTDNKVCHAGCDICSAEAQRRRKDSVTCDQVVELDPLGESHHSGSVIELKEENPWVTIKGSYLWIGIFVLPCRNELMAPHGLSPCAHLSDGCADLVLVRDCRRKDFLRLLKRFGAISKNPLQSTVVETHRVSAVRFQARQNITWEHRDVNKSEIDYQPGRADSASTSASSKSEIEVVRNVRRRPGTEVEVIIDDVSSAEEDEEDGVGMGAGPRSAVSVCSLASSSSSSSPPPCEETPVKTKKKGLRRLSLFSLKTTEASPVETKTYIKPRTTPFERERQRRLAKARGKEEKERKKAEERLRSAWILDYDACPDTELEFQVHSHILSVFGAGPGEDSRMEDSRLSWLPLF